MYVTTRTRSDLDYEWTNERTDEQLPESEFWNLINQAEAAGYERYDAIPMPAVFTFQKRDEDTGLYEFWQISYDPYREDDYTEEEYDAMYQRGEIAER